MAGHRVAEHPSHEQDNVARVLRQGGLDGAACAQAPPQTSFTQSQRCHEKRRKKLESGREDELELEHDDDAEHGPMTTVRQSLAAGHRPQGGTRSQTTATTELRRGTEEACI